MFKYKNFAIIALYFIATSALSEDYQSKSIFKHDYKCVAEEKGGYNHNANGHNLGRFKPDEELLDFMTIEHSSYFIRQPIDDPDDYLTYISGQGCSALKDDKHTSINCYTNYFGKTFQFNVTSGKFTYSYAGTWHEEVKDRYYVAPSTFAFGNCKQYYR